MIKILIFLCLLYPSLSFADKFSQDALYKVCFTPEQDCTNLIVAAISTAKKEVLVEAYSFTSAPIAKALIDAHKRGVSVKIILDKSQFRVRGFSSAKLFTDYHIPTWIDYKPNIAHNKVIILDDNVVITGSFNFTKAAQQRNAENVIFIYDQGVAKKYKANWLHRYQQSQQALGGNSPFNEE